MNLTVPRFDGYGQQLRLAGESDLRRSVIVEPQDRPAPDAVQLLDRRAARSGSGLPVVGYFGRVRDWRAYPFLCNTLAMPKRNSKAVPNGVSEAPHLLVQRSVEKIDRDDPAPKAPIPRSISRVMSKMGSKGGKIGGKRRLVTMTPEERRRVASEAARARWSRKRDQA